MGARREPRPAAVARAADRGRRLRAAVRVADRTVRDAQARRRAGRHHARRGRRRAGRAHRRGPGDLATAGPSGAAVPRPARSPHRAVVRERARPGDAGLRGAGRGRAVPAAEPDADRARDAGVRGRAGARRFVRHPPRSAFRSELGDRVCFGGAGRHPAHAGGAARLRDDDFARDHRLHRGAGRAAAQSAVDVRGRARARAGAVLRGRVPAVVAVLDLVPRGDSCAAAVRRAARDAAVAVADRWRAGLARSGGADGSRDRRRRRAVPGRGGRAGAAGGLCGGRAARAGTGVRDRAAVDGAAHRVRRGGVAGAVHVRRCGRGDGGEARQFVAFRVAARRIGRGSDRRADRIDGAAGERALPGAGDAGVRAADGQARAAVSDRVRGAGSLQVPKLVESATAQLLLAAGVFALVGVGVLAVRRGRLGRKMIAVKDSSAACATLGMNVRWIRVGVFALSAAIAGLAGGLFAQLRENRRGERLPAVQQPPAAALRGDRRCDVGVRRGARRTAADAASCAAERVPCVRRRGGRAARCRGGRARP
ncbi:hypothetical protein FXN61_01950 [Lentzea sp. PSKA42]|uniref:FtsX-like permease family protein n=1 Tax=Lentzea indica TaxID=2604800 RepID=A0ABX1FAA7_9PSEU|nr:hypothetical protein [Lentzea indica]